MGVMGAILSSLSLLRAPVSLGLQTTFRMFDVAKLRGHPHGNYQFCTFRSMDFESATINALVTNVPANHLGDAVTAAISILISKVAV